MIKEKKHLLFFLILVLLLCPGCERENRGPVQKKPLILVSLAPYAYFVDRIAEGTLEVRTLVPTGANPHLYEPTPKEVEPLDQTRLWLRMGESFEKKIFKVLKERNPALASCDLWKGIPLLSHCHTCHDCEEGKDRHLWLSPRLAQHQAKRIAESLSALFPEKSALFTQGLNDLLKDLEALDQEIGSLLEPIKNGAILVSHPAFSYFCQDYHLIQLSIESEGKDPLPQHIAEILKLAGRYQVRSVLTQPQYNNKGAELIAEKLHLPIYLIDPYARDYIENLRHIAQIISNP